MRFLRNPAGRIWRRRGTLEWEHQAPWAVSHEKRWLRLLSLDALRRRLTRVLQVSVAAQEVRRGDEVEALVAISNAQGLGNTEVGLVCTEYYAHYSPPSGPGVGGGRETASAIAHEAWLPVESVRGVQSVRLTVPQEAPFSYEGEYLSFSWEVVARGRRRRLDAQAGHEISVLP